MEPKLWSFGDLRLLLGKARREHFCGGEAIFHQQQLGDRVYLIRRGLVEISSESLGFQRRLSLLGRGEIFGEMSVLENACMASTAGTFSVPARRPRGLRPHSSRAGGAAGCATG